MKYRLLSFLLVLLLVCSVLIGCDSPTDRSNFSDDEVGASGGKTESTQSDQKVYGYASVEGIPDYSGSPYVVLNNNVPEFTEAEKSPTECYESYSPLDSLGRCGVTTACVCKNTLPTEDRESISSVKPSGWVNNAYDADLVDGRYIYNRCHLIGFQLTGENANKQNLITGTRYMNVEGMLPFENMVADYLEEEPESHVVYRVTPIFVGNNLVASGCQMEAWSVEDSGESICFNVFVYNVQPGICIDYATGENWLGGEEAPKRAESESNSEGETNGEYVLNTNTKKIHRPTCSSASSMNPSNRQEHKGSLDTLLAQGYSKCAICLD